MDRSLSIPVSPRRLRTTSSTPSRSRRVSPCDRGAFLIASAANEAGWVELPAVEKRHPALFARALFGPDETGRLVQRVVPTFADGVGNRPEFTASEPAPLEMVFFARCLGCHLGGLTPELFRIRRSVTAHDPRWSLIHPDVASEQARRLTLAHAFRLLRLAAKERFDGP